jgi:hypothetical protein
MYEYTYKYQNYLRKEIPSMGPLYTSFIVALEMYMDTTTPFEAVTWPEDQMAEIG